ncbi:hypothetical protein HBB16_01315 [Pseudonocardia sp. MCCB 268]|nr:hypothetical protein [Pseudonocardia cytotoxica]
MDPGRAGSQDARPARVAAARPAAERLGAARRDRGLVGALVGDRAEPVGVSSRARGGRGRRRAAPAAPLEGAVGAALLAASGIGYTFRSVELAENGPGRRPGRRPDAGRARGRPYSSRWSRWTPAWPAGTRPGLPVARTRRSTSLRAATGGDLRTPSPSCSGPPARESPVGPGVRAGRPARHPHRRRRSSAAEGAAADGSWARSC